MLRMSPSEFWTCDTWTVADALEGYAMSKGVKPNQSAEGGRLTAEDVRRMREAMEREEAKEAGRM